jgi:hypothetical protein
MMLGSLLVVAAVATGPGLVQANAAPAPVETSSRHWVDSVDCGTEQNARLN